MEFASPRFIVLLAATFIALRLCRHVRSANRTIFFASCVFYASWDWRYLGLLLGVGVFNYGLGAVINSASGSRLRRGLLFAAVAGNICVLGYFKYAHFVVSNAAAFLPVASWESFTRTIILPVGISFFIFKALSYVVDIYRRDIAPGGSLLDYLTFLTFFPELIAGPIVRASVFLPQLARMPGLTGERFLAGGSLFALGLVKKMLIADHMSIVADAVFDSPGAWSTFTVWCGVLAYALQIYCDFSGYSDMAIGTAKMMGYDLPQNFNMPYLAASVADFWRRWHITLSEWLRDYVYIPLGGSRAGVMRTYVNLLLTMLIGGLWHGASWNFLAWGALHGLALVIHRAWRAIVPQGFKLPAGLGVGITFLFVTLAWIPFRARTWSVAAEIWLRLLPGSGVPGVTWFPTWFAIAGILVVAGHVLGCQVLGDSNRWNSSLRLVKKFGYAVQWDAISGGFVRFEGTSVVGAAIAFTVLLLTLLFMPVIQNPFIYFQF